MSLWNLLGWYWLLGIATWFLDSSNTSLPWGDPCQGGKGSWKVIAYILLTSSLLLAQIQQEALRLFPGRGLLALFSYDDCSWIMGHASCRQCQAWMFQDQGFQRDCLSDVHLILSSFSPLAWYLFLSISLSHVQILPPHPYFSQINQHYLF